MNEGHIPPPSIFHSDPEVQFDQRRLHSLLAKALPPSAIGFGENAITPSQRGVILRMICVLPRAGGCQGDRPSGDRVRLTRY